MLIINNKVNLIRTCQNTIKAKGGNMKSLIAQAVSTIIEIKQKNSLIRLEIWGGNMTISINLTKQDSLIGKKRRKTITINIMNINKVDKRIIKKQISNFISNQNGQSKTIYQ